MAGKDPLFGDFFGNDVFDILRGKQVDAEALARGMREIIAERDAEIARLNEQVARLKRKARNNIDRAYNKGAHQATYRHPSDPAYYRKVRYADEFGDD